jgi:hypothetical protein
MAFAMSPTSSSKSAQHFPEFPEEPVFQQQQSCPYHSDRALLRAAERSLSFLFGIL